MSFYIVVDKLLVKDYKCIALCGLSSAASDWKRNKFIRSKHCASQQNIPDGTLIHAVAFDTKSTNLNPASILPAILF